MSIPVWPSRRRVCLALAATIPGLSVAVGHEVLAATPASPAGPTPVPGPQDFDAWAEAFAAEWVRLSPERATITQYFDGAEQVALDRQLSSRGPAQRRRQRELARQGLERLTRFEAATLTAERRVAAATLRFGLQRVLDAEPFEDHDFAFDQLGGLQVRAVNLFTQLHPLRRPDDIENWLERLEQLAARVDETIAQSRAAAGRGLLPPRFIVERARPQVEAFLAAPAAQNLLVTALAERSAKVPGLAPERRQQAVARATELVEAQVRPAWRRIGQWLDELLPRTGPDAGLWRLPDGAAAYRQALAGYTTTSMSPEAIHALGLREVAQIEGEMDRLLRGLGHAEGSVEARMDALRASLQPPAEPDPRPALLARYAEIIRDAERRAASVFNLKPRAPVEVRRVPALTERTVSAHYTTPAPDGTRPGIFWMPLAGPEFDIPRMRSLAYHEAIPGHHFQLAIQQQTESLPRWRQRRVFGGGSAHSEGWALYVERLAIEQGWYGGDPVGLLGAWDSLLFRARRLVVDTGLHAKRWTRREAIDYGISAREVERYVAQPGQACAYMVGMLRIVELREQARAALGARFELKGFHDLVLATGSVPLEVLAEVVQRWSASGGRPAA